MTRCLLFLFLTAAIISAYDFGPVPELPWDTAGREVIRVSNQQELEIELERQVSNRTIILEAGVWQFADFDTAFHRDFESLENITVRGATGNPEDVVLVGPGFKDTSRCDTRLCAGHIIRFINCKNVVVADFSYREWGYNGLQWEGDSTDGILVHNIHAYNVRERQIKGSAGHCKNIEIRYSRFENDSIPPADYIYNGDYVGGMDIMGADCWNIHHNFFRDIKGANEGARAAVFIWRDSRDINIYSNVFMNCDRSIAMGNSANPFDGTRHVTNALIYNNFIVAGAGRTIEICDADSVKFYHNTIYNNHATSRVIYSEDSYGTELKNNIIMNYHTNTNGGEEPVAENNVTQSVDAVWFADAPNGDLHLTIPLANILNQGLNLGLDTDFDGHARIDAPDIGADEYNSTKIISSFGSPSFSGIALSAFPNPFNPVTSIFLKSDGLIAGDDVKWSLRIFNPQGQCVHHRSVSGLSCEWNVENLPSGTYLVKAAVHGKVLTGRISLIK